MRRGGVLVDLNADMGDKFSNISHATIVNRSVVEGAFNRVKEEFGESVAKALKDVEAAINRSGNKEAAENFESFGEELQRPSPRKSILKTLWRGVLAALPVIPEIGDAIAQIQKLF